MSLKTVRRMAADLLNAGESRVWIDPVQLDETGKAVTKDDVRALIRKGFIKAHKKKGVSRAKGRIMEIRRRTGKASGTGRRRGTASARAGGKTRWVLRIRAQRRKLKELREKQMLPSKAVFRQVYLKIKGGEFADRRQLLGFLKEKGYLKQPEMAAKPQ